MKQKRTNPYVHQLILLFITVIISPVFFSQEIVPEINEDSLVTRVTLDNDLGAFQILIEYWTKTDEEKAKEEIDNYINQAELQDDKYHIANSYYIKGYLLTGEDRLYESKRYLEKSITLKLEYSPPREVSICMNQLGIVSHRLGDIERAQKYYFEALDVAESSDIQDMVGTIEINLAKLFIDIDDRENAKNYAVRAIQIFRDVRDKRSEASSYNILGSIYQQLNNSDTAKVFYRESFRLYDELGDNSGKAHVSNNLAIISFFENDLEGALENFRKALNYRKKVGDKIHLSQSLNNMAIYYQLTERYDSALFYNNQSIFLAQEVGALIELKDAYQTSEEIYESLQNSDSALSYLKRFIRIKDSIVSQETLSDIREVEAKFETDRQKKELMISKAKLKEENLQRELEKSNATLQFYVLLGIIIFMAVVGTLAFRGYQQKKKSNELLKVQHDQIKQKNEEIEKQHELLQEVNKEIEEKNNDITASIAYAKHIQQAMLPPVEDMASYCNEFGLFFCPRDIVSGDFYWAVEEKGMKFIAVADCTGHGVPGAMVSVVCSNALNKVVIEEGETDPGKILDRSSEIISNTFTKGNTTLKDGMDICVVCLKEGKEGCVNIEYAGANNPLYIISSEREEIDETLIKAQKREGSFSLFELTVNRQPVGKFDGFSTFKTGKLQLQKNDLIYLFSDGFADQFGGERGKKYKYSRFKEFLLKNSRFKVSDQMQRLEKEFISWKGDIEQIDDVCVIGIRV